ncbi:MAG: chemotaxis protein CheC [Haloquadratum sp.]
MRVDIQTLGTFNQLAREGAERAAASLEQLAGMSPAVEATTIDLTTARAVAAEFRGRDLIGVTIEFSGRLDGEALLVLDRAAARTLAENVPGGDPESAAAVAARVEEIGNILLSGFIDGWADYLDTSIDTSPPTAVTGSGVDVLPDDLAVDDTSEREQIFAFTSLLEATAAAVDTSVYLFPERDSFEKILSEQLATGSAPIPLDKLQVFNRMTERGSERASDNITTMTGIETTVEVSRLRFLPVEQTVSALSDGRYIGVVVAFEGLPSGYLLVLFDEPSAETIATHLGGGPAEDEFDAIHQSAIEEIGNIISSGFIDGWANVLETTIDHSPPEFVHDYASAILESIAADLATKQQYAFVFDSVIETADHAVSCEIFALPDEDELTRALSSLGLETDAAADTEALDDAMDADPDDLF